MNKKILALLVFVVIASMSTAFAFDLNDLSTALSSDNSTNANATNANATISGVNFKIPEGFKELSNETIKDELPIILTLITPNHQKHMQTLQAMQ